MKKVILHLLFFFLLPAVVCGEEVKIGIIGLDTSHSPAFVKSINSENKRSEFNGFRITAAYPYGSKAIQSSFDRIPEYTEQVKKFGVEVVNSIDELLKKVDVVMIETNDGNLHLEQAVEVFKSGKKVFIDKPIGANLVDAIAIIQLAKQYNVPMFSASSLRYGASTQEVRGGKHGKVDGAFTYSPAKKEPSHAGFAWYGIHGIESLYTVMGTGCESVTCTHGEEAEVATGVWKGGRVGTFRGATNGKSDYGGFAFCGGKTVPMGKYEGYEPLLVVVAEFFRTGVSPIDPNETLELFTFIQACDESLRQGGKPVSMEKVYKDALSKATKLIKEMNK